MRERLASVEGHRAVYRATFSRYGRITWRGHSSITLLFLSVEGDSGSPICDHLWFRSTMGFEAIAPLDPGDVVQFTATSRPYVKGSLRDDEGVTTDFRLSHPSHVVKLTAANQTPSLFA